MPYQLTNLELLTDLSIDKNESLTDVSLEEQQLLFGGRKDCYCKKWDCYHKDHHRDRH
ncbi:hypothetical protein NIES4106_43010 [Fischerella sp. NIES-4106]|jgi:hypothetical protein|nr:hypothetical protein NIES4106_43010 [Fischerella sp. NIES-4106]